MQRLILVRGLPGSGKSTYAREFAIKNNFVHMEADLYFLDEHGVYRFDPSKLKEAHKWCQDRTSAILYRGHSVIVSNTFTQHWEMLPYQEMAKRYRIPCEIIVMEGSYGSIHDIPEKTLERMRQRWEP